MTPRSRDTPAAPTIVPNEERLKKRLDTNSGQNHTLELEKIKAQVRARVEHPFVIFQFACNIAVAFIMSKKEYLRWLRRLLGHVGKR